MHKLDGGASHKITKTLSYCLRSPHQRRRIFYLMDMEYIILIYGCLCFGIAIYFIWDFINSLNKKTTIKDYYKYYKPLVEPVTQKYYLYNNLIGDVYKQSTRDEKCDYFKYGYLKELASKQKPTDSYQITDLRYNPLSQIITITDITKIQP